MIVDEGLKQFGKNHLGDLNEYLPTNHGFDEFFGNLYHLNAEEEPEHIDYPKNEEFKKKYGPVFSCISKISLDFSIWSGLLRKIILKMVII